MVTAQGTSSISTTPSLASNTHLLLFFVRLKHLWLSQTVMDTGSCNGISALIQVCRKWRDRNDGGFHACNMIAKVCGEAGREVSDLELAHLMIWLPDLDQPQMTRNPTHKKHDKAQHRWEYEILNFANVYGWHRRSHVIAINLYLKLSNHTKQHSRTMHTHQLPAGPRSQKNRTTPTAPIS